MNTTVPRKDLIARWDGQVPRYTSYPTAVSFHKGVDAQVADAWLGALDPAVAVSLYLHVPFCRRMCWYCGCTTVVANSAAPVDAYARDLIAEAHLLAARLPGRLRLGHIHWGGGTPTILGPAQWRRVDQAIRSLFEIEAGAEIAVEIDPRTLTQPMVAALAASGVTRASLGVQDFDAEVQQAVNRIQPFEMVAEAASRLRAARIEAINLDLMYGLPHQDEASVARTAREALALSPDRIALFGYAHVPWMKRHQRLLDEKALPGALSRLAQFEAASGVFAAAGFLPIGLDHFARPGDPLARAQREGRLRRNFQGYTDDPDPVLLGLGASAISALPQGFAQNAASIPDWRAAVLAGRLPVVRGVARTDDDRLRGALIERLMCDMALDIARVCAAHGAEAAGFADALPRLDAMAADGLLTRDGWRIAVTPAGRLFLRSIAAVFDARREQSQGRHARAV